MWPEAPAPILTEHKDLQQYDPQQQQQQQQQRQEEEEEEYEKDYIPGSFNCVDSKDPSEIIHVTRLPSGDDDGPHCNWNAITTKVWNARRHVLSSSNGSSSSHGSSSLLHVTGFDLVESKLPSDRSSSMIDFLDSLQVVDQYYPICESLLQKYLQNDSCPNARLVVKAFDHNIRIQNSKDNARILKNGGGSKAQRPIAVVHGDYTHISAPRRVEQLGQPPKTNDVLRLILNHHDDDDDDAAATDSTSNDTSFLSEEMVQDILHGKKRYAIINVWRSIDKEHVVSSFPLACCDTRTVRTDDLRTLQIHYTDRIGENYLVTHQDRHKWMYFPSMNFEEALLIKQWDSEGGIANGKMSDDGAISTFAIHSAFQTPLSLDSKPRESIEVRCLCVWEG